MGEAGRSLKVQQRSEVLGVHSMSVSLSSAELEERRSGLSVRLRGILALAHARDRPLREIATRRPGEEDEEDVAVSLGLKAPGEIAAVATATDPRKPVFRPRSALEIKPTLRPRPLTSGGTLNRPGSAVVMGREGQMTDTYVAFVDAVAQLASGDPDAIAGLIARGPRSTSSIAYLDDMLGRPSSARSVVTLNSAASVAMAGSRASIRMRRLMASAGGVLNTSSVLRPDIGGGLRVMCHWDASRCDLELDARDGVSPAASGASATDKSGGGFSRPSSVARAAGMRDSGAVFSPRGDSPSVAKSPLRLLMEAYAGKRNPRGSPHASGPSLRFSLTSVTAVCREFGLLPGKLRRAEVSEVYRAADAAMRNRFLLRGASALAAPARDGLDEEAFAEALARLALVCFSKTEAQRNETHVTAESKVEALLVDCLLFGDVAKLKAKLARIHSARSFANQGELQKVKEGAYYDTPAAPNMAEGVTGMYSPKLADIVAGWKPERPVHAQRGDATQRGPPPAWRAFSGPFIDVGIVPLGAERIFRVVVQHGNAALHSTSSATVHVSAQGLPFMDIRYDAAPFAAGIRREVALLASFDTLGDFYGFLSLELEYGHNGVGKGHPRERTVIPVYARVVRPERAVSIGVLSVDKAVHYERKLMPPPRRASSAKSARNA